MKPTESSGGFLDKWEFLGYVAWGFGGESRDGAIETAEPSAPSIGEREVPRSLESGRRGVRSLTELTLIVPKHEVATLV
jgi:hypothetical protein